MLEWSVVRYKAQGVNLNEKTRPPYKYTNPRITIYSPHIYCGPILLSSREFHSRLSFSRTTENSFLYRWSNTRLSLAQHAQLSVRHERKTISYKAPKIISNIGIRHMCQCHTEHLHSVHQTRVEGVHCQRQTQAAKASGQGEAKRLFSMA